MSYPIIILWNGVSLLHNVLKPTSSAATILGLSSGAARRSQLECSPQVVGGLRRPKSSVFSQAFIIVIGTPLKPNQILVYFDSIKYKVFNITRAIDICFKLFNLFNLQYPLQSCAVWMFIQKFYYSISTKYDTPHQLVAQVLHSLKKQK